MKKLSCILLAVMLITAMFVSCTAEVIDPYDGLAYVTFGGPASKDLSASYEVQSYENLFWFYTATKTDAYGKTGETKVETPLAVENNNHVKGLGGKIGPFSQGTWNFVLKAYNIKEENRTLVYEGSANGIKLTKSEVKSVPVSVTPQGDYGTIEFRNAYFRWNEDNGGSDKPTIKITAVGTSKTYTLLSGISAVDEYGNIPLEWSTKDGNLSIDSKYPEVLSDYYNCKIVAWVVDESSPIFEQSFGIRVYGSATTVISGDITEKVDSFVDFEVSQEDLVVFKGASSMEVLSTPVNASDKVTTVDFGSNLDGNKTYSLSVKSTTAAEAASKFTVSDGEASVAGIDLTLTTDNTPVTSFDSEITITTYITAGLDKNSVKVLYGNEGKNYLTDYDSTTGKLVFKTNHFSEYYVVTDAAASIGSTGYAFLQDAVDCARNGEKIKLLNDVDITTSLGLSIDKKITLDLNGKSIKAGERMTTNIKVYSSGSLALEDSSSDGNGRIYTEDAYVNVDNGYGIIRVFGVFIMDSGKVEAVIESEPQNKGQFGIGVGTNGKVTINGGEIKAGWYAVSNNANDSGSEITVNGGTLISTADYAIYNPGKGSSLTVTGGTIYGEAGGIAMFQGDLFVSGGTITSKGRGDTGEWGDGTGNLSNAALYVGTERAGYGDVSAIIEGGLFTAEGNAVVLNSANGKYSIKLGLKGGSFSSDPSEYVADGYTAEQNDDDPSIWTVKKAVAEVDGFYFTSLEAAFEKALTLEKPVMKILDDIDLSGKNWIPIKIGSENHAVKSLTIEGNGHSINNMTIAIAADNDPKGAPQAGSSNYYGEGFIAEVYTKTLTIRNLTFNSANVNDSGMDETPEHHTSGVSVVVGRNCYSTVNLENVNVIDSKVYGGEKVGALIGHCMGGKTNINGGSVKNTTVTCTWYYSAMLIGFAHDKARITVNEAVLESNSNTYDLKWSDVTASYTTTEGDTVAWEPYGNPGLWVYAAWKDQIAMTGGTEESTYNNGTYEGKINGHALSFTKVGTAYSGDWTL